MSTPKSGAGGAIRKRVRIKSFPIALTVAGSDSGGGAGIQADLKTFAALKTHGTSVITCLTAQNPRGVLGVHVCPAQMVRLQLEAVFGELPPASAKTGMLFSASIIREVCDFFDRRKYDQLVVDPVMVATSGATLLKPDALRLIRDRLLPRCKLVTPNLDEASLLTGKELRDVEDLRTAERQLHATYGCAALVKGGHLRGMNEAIDVFYDGAEELLLSAPYAKGVSTHGTGCTYSAAITACLARGECLSQAIRTAKSFITEAIHDSREAARHTVLHSFWKYF